MIGNVSASVGAGKAALPVQQLKREGVVQGFIRSALDIVAAQFRRLGAARLESGRVGAVSSEAVKAQDAAQQAQGVLSSSGSFLGRTKIFLRYFIQLDSVADSVAVFCKAFRVHVPAFIRESARLLPLFDFVNFAFSFLFLGISLYSARQARALFRKFSALMEGFDEKEDKDKVAVLGEALKLIDVEGEALREHLLLSKDGQVALTRKVDFLRQHITQQQPFDKADEVFVRALAKRVKLQLRFMQVDIASEVVSIVGSAIFFAPMPIAGQAVSLSIIAASGVASVVSWGARFFLVTRNPFDDAPKNRIMLMLDAVSGAVSAARQFLAPRGQKSPAQA